MGGGDRIASAASQPIRSTNPKEHERNIELAIDSILLSKNPSRKSVSDVFSLISSSKRADYLKLLLSPRLKPLTFLNVNTSFLGSYLTSRLMWRGVQLQFDVECMYALANAVRASLPIEIIRWRFILGKFIKSGVSNSAALQLLRQTDVVIKTMSSISNSNDIKWEKGVLGIK